MAAKRRPSRGGHVSITTYVSVAPPPRKDCGKGHHLVEWPMDARIEKLVDGEWKVQGEVHTVADGERWIATREDPSVWRVTAVTRCSCPI